MEPAARKELQALIRRHVEAENAHRMEDTLATIHPDCVFEDVPMQRVFRGHAGAREYYRMWWEGLRIVITPGQDDRRMWTDDGLYVAETSFTGVHVGPFLGIPPTGRTISFRFAVFVPFRDGLMAGERFYYDLDGLLRQLGAGRPALAAQGVEETGVKARFDLRAASPDGFAAMMRLNAHVHGCGLDAALLEIVKIRVSQINGCAFCVDMHVTAARRLGVEEQRLHLIAVWRETPGFSEAERAALNWAEVLTRLPGGEVSEAAYAQACAHFSVAQVAELALAVAEINAWNRLMMAARTPPMSAIKTSAATAA